MYISFSLLMIHNVKKLTLSNSILKWFLQLVLLFQPPLKKKNKAFLTKYLFRSFKFKLIYFNVDIDIFDSESFLYTRNLTDERLKPGFGYTITFWICVLCCEFTKVNLEVKVFWYTKVFWFSFKDRVYVHYKNYGVF